MSLSKIVRAALVAAAAIVPLLIAGPLAIFSGNAGDFSSGLFDLLPLLGMGFFVLAAALTLLVVLGGEAMSALVMALALGFYLQGNVILWDYGAFDGSEIPWKKFASRGTVDYAVWGAIACAALFLTRWCARIAPALSALLIVMQLGSVVAVIAQKPPRLRGEISRVSPQDLFRFSKERNILMIVLDEFQSGAMRVLAEQEPRYREAFRGFTFYADALSGFPTTYASIPSMFTGVQIKPGESISGHLSSMRTHTLPHAARSDGFRTDVLIHAPFRSLCQDGVVDLCVTSGEVLAGGRETVNREILQLLDFSLFRHVPHALKRAVYNNQAWTLSRNDEQLAPQQRSTLALVDRFVAHSSADSAVPTFKFAHLLVPHSPYRLNPECGVAQSRGRRGFKAAYFGNVRCALFLVERILERMRELGVFDQTTIVVAGDHGSGFDFGREKSFAPYKTRAFPLLMVKPATAPGEKLAPLEVSWAPASLLDIPATVADLAGLKAQLPGVSLRTLAADRPRRRPFTFYGWKHRFWAQDVLPESEQFLIEGSAYDARSWRKVSPGARHAPGDTGVQE